VTYRQAQVTILSPVFMRLESVLVTLGGFFSKFFFFILFLSIVWRNKNNYLSLQAENKCL